MLSTKLDPVLTGTSMPVIHIPKVLTEDRLYGKILQCEKNMYMMALILEVTIPECALRKTWFLLIFCKSIN